MRLRVPKRALLFVGTLYGALIALLALWLWQRWGGQQTTRVVDNVASLAGVVFAAGCAAWAAARSTARFRLGWYAMTAGLSAWAAGQFMWTWYEMSGPAPFPSWADVGYLAFYGGAAAAVLLLSTDDRGQSVRRLLLDAAIVAASVFLILWVTVLEPVFRAGADSRLAMVVSLAYPIADCALITIAWSRAAAAYRTSLRLLIGGLVLIALSDSVYAVLTATGSYDTGHPVDLGWLAGCGLLGLAALLNVGEPSADATMGLISSHGRLWGPYVPLVVACAVGMTYAVPRLDSLPLAGTGTFLIAAVLIRQFFVLLENRRLLSDVARLAFRDQLTGLANRALFVDRVDQAVARRRRSDDSFAVLCLDLDKFKAVNDELGHPAGDELLMRVARRLTDCLRSTDLVARLGGDEFAVLIAGSPDEARVAADRILDSFTEPIVIDGVALTIRPSIGLTVAGAHATVDDLLKYADLAMYAAKRDGGGCLRVFAPKVPDIAEPLDISTHPVQTPASAPARGNAARAPRWPPTDIRFALAALLTGVIAYTVATLARTGSVTAFERWLEAILYLSAAALVAARAYRVRTECTAWAFIAAGLAATGCGTAWLAIPMATGRSPSPVDPVFLASFPAIAIGLILLVRSRLPRAPSLLRLDAVIAALTAAAAGTAIMSGFVSAATGRTFTALLVTMAYPIGSVVLLALAVALIAVRGWLPEPRWLLVAAGFALWLLANTVYSIRSAHGDYDEGTWIDTCWPISFLLLAVAAWLKPTSTVPTIGAVARFGPPGVCAAVALAVAIAAPGDRASVTLAALTLTVIAARFAVTFRDASEAENHRRGDKDELTGLADRRGLITALQNAPAPGRGAPANARLGLLLIDVDHFDEINDAFDRTVGDQLLRHIAARLSRAVGSADLVARTGGDEFAVLLREDVNLMTARAQAGSLMDALRPPFALDHLAVQVDVSISIAMWPEHCSQPQELLSRAEAALPKAQAAASRIGVYNAAVDLQRDSDEQLIDDLRAALSATESDAPGDACAGRLICHYQPKITADDERVHSVEALVRWQHPTRGQLPPDQFLAVAERAGLMRLVTTRVLDIALAQLRRWREQGITLTVAVNLSTTNLLDVGLVDTIDALLATHGLPAQSLILEITEHTLSTDSQRARNTVTALQRLGIRLSLDDYGTGWSSLARLQDLSVDELKLDRVFVARLARDPRSIAIVRSTVALAHSLGADLVAEGVEDTATLHALRKYGCTITQGHVHSRPLPADELHDWLVSRSSERYLKAAQHSS